MTINFNSLEYASCTIIGGGGFLGTNLALELQAVGAKVTLFGRNRRNIKGLEDVTWLVGKLDDMEVLSSSLKGANYVFHLAEPSSPAEAETNRIKHINNSTISTLRLLDLCLAANITRVIFASSGGTVYGEQETTPISEVNNPRPISSYGINKLMSEYYFHLYNETYGMENIILRISNPFGPFQHAQKKQGIIPMFLRNALMNKAVTIVGDGNNVRDFVYSSDVAKAMIAAAKYRGLERTFNIGSGIGRSINEVITDVNAICDRKIHVEYVESRKFDVRSNILNCSLAKDELKWLPHTNWYNALSMTKNWIKAELNT